jgi:DNA-binding MarR family transcriptional regulator
MMQGSRSGKAEGRTTAKPSHGEGAITRSPQGKAWRMLLEVHRDVVAYLEADFRKGLGLELVHYDVLLHVWESDGGLRMTDLAEAVVLSKSGLTSVVDRMEAQGLIRRQPDAADRRATRIGLTEAGEARYREAAAYHARTVRRIFTSLVTEKEAGVLEDVLSRVRERVRVGPEQP